MIPKREVAKKIEPEKHLGRLDNYNIELDLPKSKWARKVRKEQNGKELHGDLVVASHKFLVDELGVYSTYREAVSELVREEGFLAGIPDAHDRENKLIIECGFNGWFSDETFDFIVKVCGYVDKLYMSEDFDLTEWTFMHFPKSIEEGDPCLVIEFNQDFRELVDEEAERYREELRESVNNAAQNWL